MRCVAILMTCTLAAVPQPQAPQTRVELRFVPGSDECAGPVREYERRGGPYPDAWDEAMRLTAEERAARWRAIFADRLPRRR